MAKEQWTILHNLSSSEYRLFQTGSMDNVEVKNETDTEMLVTQVVIQFEWQTTDFWYRDCNIHIGPGETVKLPSVTFNITLDASIGAHEYRPGITYKLLKESKWELKRGFVFKSFHLMITKSPDRNFQVFISHSNSPKESSLLNTIIESFSRCGIKCYVAERTPEPGYPLWQKIFVSIRQSDAILILWTEDGSLSGDIREEIGLAFGANKTKRIIPFVQEGLSTKGSLIGLEHISLNINDPIVALSTAIPRAIEWAENKLQGKPKIST